MKAVFCPKYGPPEVLQIREVERPVAKDHEVLIKIHATTVTVADIRVRSFTIPPSFWLPARLILGITKPKHSILGVELAGEVESVGKDVRLFKKGDQVFGTTSIKQFGAYAEYKCIPESGSITIKPDSISYEEATAIPLGARTALHYLKKANIRSGQKLLIYGASGSVGTYAIQLAKHFGAEVTGICSTANMELVKSLGAEKVIDYTSGDFIKDLETYDVIFIAIDKFPFSVCNKVLNAEGIYLNITAPIKSVQMMWTTITSKKKIVVGENLPQSAEDLDFLKGLVETGKLKPVIDRSYTLDQIVDAHRYVDKGHKKGNVVIKVG